MTSLRRTAIAAFCFSLLSASPSPGQTVTLLADIEPGPSWSLPSQVTASGGLVFFRAFDDTNGERLWKTDGTPAGTTPIFDPSPSSTAGITGDFVDVSGTLFFWSTPAAAIPRALWKTDGTALGTVHVADVSPTAPQPTDPTQAAAAMNGWLYFIHGETDHGELWKSNGTTTEKVADLPTAEATRLTVLAGRLYFFHQHEVWTSDGTTAGTYLLIDFYQLDPGLTCPPWTFPYPAPPFPQCLLLPYFETYFAEAGGKVFLALLENIGTDLTVGLWTTDGTVAGTTRIRTVTSWAFSMATMNDELYLTLDDPTTGQELWKSDGTPEGTVLVADLVPGTESSDFLKVTAGDSTLWLLTRPWPAGQNQPIHTLWTSDGTAAGTAPVEALPPTLNSFYPFTIGDKVFLTMTTPCFGPELWMSEGVATALRRVTNLDSGSGASSSIAWYAKLGSSLVFGGRGALGYEPYVYDGGTPSGDCGNGVLEAGESCDAGDDNGQPENCCACDCLAVPAGIACNASGLTCGAQTCDGTSGECPASPLADCGNGALDAGEACDEGDWNGLPWRCCDCACQFLSAATTCRDGDAPCDPAESCTGSSAGCPTDIGEPDTDEDEICESVDACSNADNQLGTPRLSLDARSRKGKIQASLTVSNTDAIDPVAHGLRLIVSNADQSMSLFDVTLPGGAYDDVTKVGWRSKLSPPSSSSWKYGNRDGFEGITGVSIKGLGFPGALKVKVKLLDATFTDSSGVTVPHPLRLTIIVDPPTASSAACADYEYADDQCRADATNQKVRCR